LFDRNYLSISAASQSGIGKLSDEAKEAVCEGGQAADNSHFGQCLINIDRCSWLFCCVAGRQREAE
jgi:hypothetical protein